MRVRNSRTIIGLAIATLRGTNLRRTQTNSLYQIKAIHRTTGTVNNIFDVHRYENTRPWCARVDPSREQGKPSAQASAAPGKAPWSGQVICPACAPGKEGRSANKSIVWSRKRRPANLLPVVLRSDLDQSACQDLLEDMGLQGLCRSPALLAILLLGFVLDN